MQSVFDYTHYRKFLSDSFERLRKEQPQFSQKWVMMELGVRSTGFLSNVLAGKKNLNPAQVDKLCQILQLTQSEAEHFAALVGYDQSRNAQDMQMFYEIIESIHVQKIRALSKSELDLFARWSFVAMRELLSVVNFRSDYRLLGRMLMPAITAGEAREAVDFLYEQGFIEKDRRGFFRPVESLVTTSNEIKSASVVAFQLKMIDLAKESLLAMPVDMRDISAISFCATPEIFHTIKRETQQFRKRMLELAESHQAKTPKGAKVKIYQLNMQFFPVSEELELGKEV
jgi:uncharacterized protein (TIGR02147 family)